MQDMIDFSTVILNLLAEFLATPPIFYLFGLICLCYVAQVIKILIKT